MLLRAGGLVTFYRRRLVDVQDSAASTQRGRAENDLSGDWTP